MPQRTRPCPGDRAAAAMGGQGRQTSPGRWDHGCRWGLPGPPGSSNNPGLPPSAEVQVSEPPQLCPFGSGASPPGRGGHNKALQLGAGPQGGGIKPAASWASICAGKWGTRGLGRGLGAPQETGELGAPQRGPAAPSSPRGRARALRATGVPCTQG